VTRASLARIVRSQGRRGEVRAAILTDFPERLLELRRAFLWDGAGEPRPVVIRSCRFEPSRQMAVFHFEGCDSIDAAKSLVGLEIQIPLADRVQLPAGSYYISDLLGCELFAPGSSVPLGRVADVQPTGEQVRGTPLLIVETPQGELLVPLAADICREIDIAGRRIVAVLPEGLKGLNSE
jgi:16S rRNA processing protein RimM